MKRIVVSLVVLVLIVVAVALFWPRKAKKVAGGTWKPGHSCAKEVPMRELAGRKFGGLLTNYTGISGRVPEKAQLDFCAQLEGLWEVKQRRSKRNGVVTSTAKSIVSEYHNEGTGNMTLKEYVGLVDDIVDTTRDDLDWEAVGKIERLNSRRLKLVRNITNRLKGEDFVAYSATELMPTLDGQLNIQVYEFLLRQGGRRYVESIPAIYDPYTSFGAYQFTQYAWYENGKEKRGGSKLNGALGKPVPHGSVAQLRGDEHHVAALLFAIDNLSMLVRGLNEKQLRTLERVYRSKHDEIVQFVATAHNYPYGKHGAEGAGHRWLQNGAKQDYIVSCSNKPRGYAKKTKVNLAALKQAL